MALDRVARPRHRHATRERAEQAALWGATQIDGSSGHRIVDRVEYRSAAGDAAVSLRIEFERNGKRSKTFGQIHQAADGRWIVKLPDPRPRYLPFAPLGFPDGVIIVEGEKSVRALERIGIHACTSLGGSSAAELADWSPLHDVSVVVWPDVGMAGVKYLFAVAGELAQLGTKAVTRVYPETDRPDNWDVADLIEELEASGLTPTEVKRRVVEYIVGHSDPWELPEVALPALDLTADPPTLRLDFEFRAGRRCTSLITPRIDREVVELRAARPARLVLDLVLPFDAGDGSDETDVYRRRVLDRLQEIERRLLEAGVGEVAYRQASGAVGELRHLVESWVWGQKIRERQAAANVVEGATNAYPDDLPGDIHELQPPLQDAIREALAEELRSVSIVAYPGSGKTTIASREALAKLGRVGGVAVLVLPRAADVAAKVEAAEELALELGVAVRVLPLLGRRPADEASFACADHAAIRSRAELAVYACAGCGVRAACGKTPGQYHADLRETLKAIESREPVFVVATMGALAMHRDAIPSDADVIVDDMPDAHAGTVSELSIAVQSLHAWREHTRDFLTALRDGGWDEARAIKHYQRTGVAGPAMLLPTLRDIARAMVWRSKAKMAAALQRAPVALHHAIKTNAYVQPTKKVLKGNKTFRVRVPWDWETPTSANHITRPDDEGVERIPQLTNVLMMLLREYVVHGTTPRLKPRRRGDPDQIALLPNRDLIDRARRGRVVWLAVAPMPDLIASKLGLDVRTFAARPRGLRLLVPVYGGAIRPETGVAGVATMGGRRRTVSGREVPTTCDVLFRRTVKDAAKRGPVAAIGHKVDHRELDDVENVTLRHFGSGHASANEMAHLPVAIVRRFQRPPGSAEIDADAIRMAFDVDEETVVDVATELRRWSPEAPLVAVKVPFDPVARDVARFDDGYFMLNAIERTRSLLASANGEVRTALLLDGWPRDMFGAAVTTGTPEEIGAELDLDLSLPRWSRAAQDAALARENEEREKARQERRRRLLKWIREQEAVHKAWGVADAADGLGEPYGTVKRDLEALRQEGGFRSAHTCSLIDIYAHVCAERDPPLELPSIHALAKASGASRTAARRLLDDVKPMLLGGGAIDIEALMTVRRGRDLPVRRNLVEALLDGLSVAQGMPGAEPAVLRQAAGGEVRTVVDGVDLTDLIASIGTMAASPHKTPSKTDVVSPTRPNTPGRPRRDASRNPSQTTPDTEIASQRAPLRAGGRSRAVSTRQERPSE